MRTPWTKSYLIEFIENHERVISQYPLDIQVELRDYRTHFLHGIPIIDAAGDKNGKAV